MASRIDTLQRPRGAGKAPFVVLVMVLAVVGAMIVVGLSGWGWLVAFTVPMLALTLYIVINTVRIMRQGEGEREEEVEERA